MQFKFFLIPLADMESTEQELNTFLRGHRILHVERHFCTEANGYWAVCVEYVDGQSSSDNQMAIRRNRKDYTKELSDTELQRFESFKKIRRELAQQKSLPAYMVFTDAELAVLASVTNLSEESAANLKVVTPSKLRDYASYFFPGQNDEKSGEPDAGDSID